MLITSSRQLVNYIVDVVQNLFGFGEINLAYFAEIGELCQLIYNCFSFYLNTYSFYTVISSFIILVYEYMPVPVGGSITFFLHHSLGVLFLIIDCQ